MADSHREAVTELDRETASLSTRAQNPLSGVLR